MNSIKNFKTIGIDILKGTATAVAAIVGMVVGGMLTTMLGLPAAEMPKYMSLTVIMPLMFLTWILVAILMGECFQRIYSKYWQRLLSIWLCSYLLYSALNTLDSLLFMPIPNMTTSFFSNIFSALFPTLVIAWLWKPGPSIQPVKTIAEYFSARKGTDWVWRFIAAWLIYPPLYYLIGRVVGIFTQHYYEDGSLNLGLTLPSVGTMMAMQVLRGVLFLLAVLPVIIPWRGTRKALWLWVGALIFLQISAQTMIQAYWFPPDLRIAHTLELLADSFIQAFLYTVLLFVPPCEVAQPVVRAKSPVRDDFKTEKSF
jgi:hypothetical protein